MQFSTHLIDDAYYIPTSMSPEYECNAQSANWGNTQWIRLSSLRLYSGLIYYYSAYIVCIMGHVKCVSSWECLQLRTQHNTNIVYRKVNKNVLNMVHTNCLGLRQVYGNIIWGTNITMKCRQNNYYQTKHRKTGNLLNT